ncbi:MAG: hypothetical protein H6725_02415 [Sandaracinaceae bacterium]|nr:hypothetical protein [Sandaracinaceae bacterium]
MPLAPPPVTLPYATQVERDMVRARLVAALVTGPCGLLLLLASPGELVLFLLGALCVLASVGWLVAARRGRKRAVERAAWSLTLREDGLSVSTAEGTLDLPRANIVGMSLDDDTLQVVCALADGTELRLDPAWGSLGVVDLHSLLEDWWTGRLPSDAG